MWNRQANPARLFQLEFSLRLYMIYKVIYDYKNIKKTWVAITFHIKLYIEQDKKKKARQFLEEGNLV